jgi:hypothetical protein
MSSGSTSAAKSGKVATSCWMRASNFAFADYSDLEAEVA